MNTLQLAPSQSETEDAFMPIRDAIQGSANPAAPDNRETEGIWKSAVRTYQRLVGEGATRVKASKAVRKYLLREARFLAPGEAALLKTFKRRLSAESLRDGREKNTSNPDYVFPESDKELLIYRTIWKNGGRVAPAWWSLLQGKELSAPTVARYYGKSTDPGHVPDLVSDAVMHEIEPISALHRGQRYFDAIKGSVQRSYEGICSMDILQADDFTMPIYYYVPDGNGWYNLIRGQVLLVNDFRSHRILGYALIPHSNYDSLAIYSLHTRIFARHGIPKVLYWERGIWESSKVLKGKANPYSRTRLEGGLGDLGIEFVHAHRARSKTIERIGETEQRLMEGEPEYCGRDERRDLPEILRRKIALVRVKKLHPAEYFRTLEQWNERFEELQHIYNAKPQPGSRILEGRSPDMGFLDFANHEDPPHPLSADVRLLFATYRERRSVGTGGITFRFGKRQFCYRGESLSPYVNREVIAHFDPDNPEACIVTDTDYQNPVSVDRAIEPNAMEMLIEPGSGKLAGALSQAENQLAHSKTLFKVIESKHAMPIRRNLTDVQTLEKNQAIGRCRDEATMRNRVKSGQASAKERFKAELGYFPDGEYTSDELDTLRETLNKQLLEERENAAQKLMQENPLDFV